MVIQYFLFFQARSGPRFQEPTGFARIDSTSPYSLDCLWPRHCTLSPHSWEEPMGESNTAVGRGEYPPWRKVHALRPHAHIHRVCAQWHSLKYTTQHGGLSEMPSISRALSCKTARLMRIYMLSESTPFWYCGCYEKPHQVFITL